MSALTAFTTATEALIDRVAKFNEDNFNQVPFEGSWTAARVVQHLYLSMQGIPGMFNVTKDKTERDPEQHRASIESIFLNMETKMKSPDFIFPEDKIYDHKEMLNKLKQAKTDISASAEGKDLTLTTPFAFPGVGALTMVETLYFLSVHNIRHTEQLARIHDIVK